MLKGNCRNKNLTTCGSFIKRQTSGTTNGQMTTSVTTSNNEWQWVTTNDNEWHRVVQRMTTSDNEWCNDWHQRYRDVFKPILIVGFFFTIVTRNNSLEIRAVKLRFLLIYKNMLKSTATTRSECTAKQQGELHHILLCSWFDWLLWQWLKRDQNADWKKKYS